MPPLEAALLTWLAEQTLYPLVTSWPVPTRSAETYLVRRDRSVRGLASLRTTAWTSALVVGLSLLLVYAAGYQPWRLEESRLGAWDWDIASGAVRRNDYWAAMPGDTLEEVDDAAGS